jgi:hypothetical protein
MKRMDTDEPKYPGHEQVESGSNDRDPMAPPEVPCECYCLHCQRTFMSDRIWLQRVRGSQDGFEGFWMCPTPNCSGAGFTFDIFPTDPDHPGNEGWFSCGDEEEDEDLEWDEEEAGEFSEPESAEPETDYDPSEPAYGMMDQMCADEGDIEGEEWKFGVQPGEIPSVDPPPPGMEPRNWMEEEAIFNAPDRRPREVDWTDREQRNGSDPEQFSDEDIPF